MSLNWYNMPTMAREDREIPPLKQGEPIVWPDLPADLITHVFDARTNLQRTDRAYGRGYMGVRSSGNIDVFWHRWEIGSNGISRVLTHHGGKEGFPDIEIPLRQCRRIIAGYIGIEDEIEPEDELAPSDQKPPVSLREFGNLLGEVKTFVIPGHQQWVENVRIIIDQAIREVVYRPGNFSLGRSFDMLQAVRTKLDISTNPLLRETGMELEEALLAEDRFGKLAALQRGGQRILARMGQIDGTVLSIMNRHNRLEAHRTNSEETVLRLANEIFRQKSKLDDGVGNPDLIYRALDRQAKTVVGELKTNPFKRRAERLSQMTDLEVILTHSGSEVASGIVEKAAKELVFWKKEIKEAQRGRFNNRFPVGLV